jgi:hypothetical protein
MIDKIRDRLAVDLNPVPVFNRLPAVAATKQGGGNTRSALVVSSSHAGKLAAAMRAGHNTEVIYEATRDNVFYMAQKVREDGEDPE